MKYFVISDVHSFFIEMKEALEQAGFRKTDPNHTLIVAGDLFDRGPDAIKVYNYIRSIPKSRRILIRGNHEQLLLDLLLKTYPEGHDFSNGTADTVCQLAGGDVHELSEYKVWQEDDITYDYPNWCKEFWVEWRDKAKKHPIVKWLRSKEWRDYYELDRFIIVHSFIPVKLREGYESFRFMPYWRLSEKLLEYDGDWRNGYWPDAMWGCPWSQYQRGFFQPEEDKGKTLVCGHWHTSDFFSHLKNIHLKEFPGPIYYSKGLIGIDGGCCSKYDILLDDYVYTHPQNVLVIDENFKCFDKFGNELVEPEALPEIETIPAVEVESDE